MMSHVEELLLLNCSLRTVHAAPCSESAHDAEHEFGKSAQQTKFHLHLANFVVAEARRVLVMPYSLLVCQAVVYQEFSVARL